MTMLTLCKLIASLNVTNREQNISGIHKINGNVTRQDCAGDNLCMQDDSYNSWCMRTQLSRILRMTHYILHSDCRVFRDYEQRWLAWHIFDVFRFSVRHTVTALLLTCLGCLDTWGSSLSSPLLRSRRDWWHITGSPVFMYSAGWG